MEKQQIEDIALDDPVTRERRVEHKDKKAAAEKALEDFANIRTILSQELKAVGPEYVLFCLTES
jgi:hypothetical protein